MNGCKTEMTFTEVDGDGELVYVCFDCGAMEYRVLTRLAALKEES